MTDDKDKKKIQKKKDKMGNGVWEYRCMGELEKVKVKIKKKIKDNG